MTLLQVLTLQLINFFTYFVHSATFIHFIVYEQRTIRRKKTLNNNCNNDKNHNNKKEKKTLKSTKRTNKRAYKHTKKELI